MQSGGFRVCSLEPSCAHSFCSIASTDILTSDNGIEQWKKVAGVTKCAETSYIIRGYRTRDGGLLCVWIMF